MRVMDQILRFRLAKATIFCMLAIFSIPGFSQIVTSVSDGAWNNPSTWSSNPIIPTGINSDSIIINHQITVPGGFSVSIDGTRITPSASLTVQSSGSLNVNNASSALRVQGTLVAANNSVITGTLSSNTSFLSGSTYRHEFTTTQGVLPLATWSANSTVRITGYTTFSTASAAGNWGQTFGNLVFDCSGLSTTFYFGGFLNSLQGSLSIVQTGSSVVFLTSSGNPTVSIGSDFIIGGNGRAFLSTTSSTTPGATIIVGRDFRYETSNVVASGFNTVGHSTLHVARDFVMNSTGVLRLGSNTNTSVGFLRIGRNFNLIAGQLTETSAAPARGEVIFTGTSGTVHTFQNTGSITNTINYLVESGNTLTILDENNLVGGTGSTLTVDGILELQSTHVAGAIQTGSGPGSGNVRTVNRIYNAGSRIVYAGNAPQFLGNGNPTSLTTTVVIDNASGVNVVSGAAGGNIEIESGFLEISAAPLVINGNLTLTGGNVNLITTSTPRSLTIHGAFVANGGTLSVNSGGTEATVSVNGTYSGTSGFVSTGANTILSFGGTGPLSGVFPLSGVTSLKTVNVNRMGGTVGFDQNLTVVDMNLTSGSVDMDARLTVTDDLNLSTSTVLSFPGETLELRSQFNNELSGGVLAADGSSVLQITGTGALGTLAFDGAGNTLGSFLLNRSTSGVLVTLNSPLTIASVFELRRGQFQNTSGLTFSSGSTFIRNSQGSLVGVIPGGGSYNLQYTGTALTTGLEAQGNLLDLIVGTSGIVTLAGSLDLAGSLFINSGTLTAGSNPISTGDVTNNGVFNLPSSSLTITGNLVNNSTFNRGTGLVIFDGNTSISGTVNPIFNAIQIDGQLSSPVTFQVNGNFTNNGVFTNNGNTVLLGGSALQTISGTSITSFANLTINNSTNPVGVTIESNQYLFGILSLGTNNVLDADGVGGTARFFFRSLSDDPATDARLAPMPAGAVITGNVIVQRFMSMEGRINRYISMPVQNVRLDSLQDDFSVTGPFTGTSFPCTGCTNNNYSLRYYFEPQVGVQTAGARGFPQPPGATNAAVLPLGTGFYNFMHNGNNAQITWDAGGSVFSGTFNFGVTFTPSVPTPLPNDDGFNLLGNPYVSPIDWNSVAWTRTNVSPTVFVNDQGQNVFRFWNHVTNSGDADFGGIIATGQSFWIQTTGASPLLTISESAKFSGSGYAFYRNRGSTSQLKIALRANGMEDRTYLVKRPGTQIGTDGIDSRKMMNETLNIGIGYADQPLAINHLEDLKENEVVELVVDCLDCLSATMTFDGLDVWLDQGEMYLNDRFLNQSVKLFNGMIYSFDMPSINQRFALSRKPLVSENVEQHIHLYPNPSDSKISLLLPSREPYSVQVFNSYGQAVDLLFNRVENGNQLLMQYDARVEDLLPGVYLVKLISTKNLAHTLKFIKR